MFFALLLIFFLLIPRPILASNHQFGLHLSQPSDLESAAKVINSSGGDWGWVTIVIRLDQLDQNTWQSFFDQCRRLHLIPLIRLSTTMAEGYWAKPTQTDIDQLAEFLDSLNWPTQQQHIILFNEINHASEWGGQINIAEFTQLSSYAAQKFKSLNPNFYILSTGLDLAAPDAPPGHMSAATVYRQILQTEPNYFNYIDALSSHSYPNHGFVGKPSDTGQHSIRGYLWELNFLKTLGVGKTLPVYITETGWPHRQGDSADSRFYTTKTSAAFLAEALSFWNQDNNIKAITPFIFNYPYPPFDHFSWLDKSQNIYPEYQPLIDLPKNQNRPSQINKYKDTKLSIPFIILPNRTYQGKITLKNTGQAIWGRAETNFCLNPQTTPNISLSQICTDQNSYTQPGESQTFEFQFSVSSSVEHQGNSYLSWQDLPPFQITPVVEHSTIYRPKTGLLEKITVFFRNLFVG